MRVSIWVTAVLVCGKVWAAAPETGRSSSRPARVTPFVVALDGATSPLAPQVQVQAEHALLQQERFETMLLSDAVDPQGAKERRRKRQEAEAVAAAGQKAYDELDTQKSFQLFDRALKAYEQTNLSRNFEELTRAWVMKIASLIANGEIKTAELEIDRLLPLAPKAVFPPNYFPPDQVKYAEKTRRSVSLGGSSELDIRTTPPGARIYVNGQFRGVSPVSLKNLPAADHYVTAMADGYVLGQQRARQGAVQLTLKRTAAGDDWFDMVAQLQKTPTGPAMEKAVRKFSQEAGADEAMVTLLQASGARTRVTILRVPTREGQPVPSVQGTVSGPTQSAELDRFYAQVLAKDGGDPLPILEARTTAEPSSWNDKKTGYVLLGGAAVATVLGSIFAVNALAAQSRFRNTPQGTPEALALSSGGQRSAIFADISFIAALVAGGLGTHFVFFKDASPASPTGTQAAR